MNIKKIETATITDAREWANDTEKTLFCLDFLEEGSIDTEGFDDAQDELENKFEMLLA